jgi:tetratricopeptide (TPR) repeat protein
MSTASRLTALFRPSRRRAAVVLPALAVAAAYLAYGRWRPADPAPGPPAVELTGADPLVAKAVAAARAGVEAKPRSGPAWGHLGMVLMAHEYSTEALECLRRAEQLTPGDGRWPYLQGMLLMREHPEEAVAPFQRAAAHAWRDETPHLRLAELLLDLDRLDEAEAVFRRVGDHPRALLGLGLIARRRGDVAGCVPLLERAAASPTARRAALAVLADAHQQLGHAETAARVQRDVARLGRDPAWPDPIMAEVTDLQTGTRARLNRVNGLLNANRVADALAVIQEILRDDPGSDLAHLALGRALMQANDFTAAEKAMADAARRFPDSFDAHFMRGGALMNLGRADDAAACFRAALKLNPTHGLTHLYLARALRKQGDGPGARAALRDALHCRPDLAPAHVELAELLLQDGDKAGALAHLRDALRLNSDDEAVKKMIASIQ